MRTPFLLTVLAAAISLHGCGTHEAAEVALIPPTSAYDDRILDSLGSQRYAEQNQIYLRKVDHYQKVLKELEEKRAVLEASIGVANLDVASGESTASFNEAQRISDYVTATQSAQVRIAKESASRSTNQAEIENERDRKLLQAELDANRRLAELERTFNFSIDTAKNEAERARLKSQFEAEQRKAEAQREKALLEAESAKELSQIEARYQLLIQERERELASARSDHHQRKAQRLAAIDEKLATELGIIASRATESTQATPDGQQLSTRTKADFIKAELAIAQAEIKSEARVRIAQLEAKTEIAKAEVVAPVATSRAVYAGKYDGNRPENFAVAPQKKAERDDHVLAGAPKSPAASKPFAQGAATVKEEVPTLIVSRFEPRVPQRTEVHTSIMLTDTVAGGGASKPLVVAPATTNYSVVYRYQSKEAAMKFKAFLEAYGVQNVAYRFAPALNEHVLFLGRYSLPAEAAARVAHLNRLTSTSHAQIVERDL